MEDEDFHKINLGNENLGNGNNANNFWTLDHSKLHSMKIPHEHRHEHEKHNVDIQAPKENTAKPENLEHSEKPKVPQHVPENTNSEKSIQPIYNPPKSSYRYLKCNIKN